MRAGGRGVRRAREDEEALVDDRDGSVDTPCRGRVLYAASTFGHLRSFHLPYIAALARDGFQVDLLAGGEPLGLDALPPEVGRITARFVKSMASPRNFGVAAQVARLQRERRYGTVLVHTSLAAFFVRLGLAGAGVRGDRPRVVNTVHGYLFDDATPFARRRVMLAAERLCAGVTDEIVVMNRQDARIAREYGLARGAVHEVAGVGVGLAGMRPATPGERAAARARLGIPSEAFVCLCAAEFSARKSQRTLIEGLRSTPADVILALPGTGALLDECRALADALGLADRVVFPGYLSAGELSVWRAAGDACVSASRYEGLPCHVVEAFACGLPAVLSDVKGHEDLAGSGECGLLYPYGDAGAFARCIRELHGDRALAARMGAQARKASARYDRARVMPGLLAIYERRGSVG